MLTKTKTKKMGAQAITAGLATTAFMSVGVVSPLPASAAPSGPLNVVYKCGYINGQAALRYCMYADSPGNNRTFNAVNGTIEIGSTAPSKQVCGSWHFHLQRYDGSNYDFVDKPFFCWNGPGSFHVAYKPKNWTAPGDVATIWGDFNGNGYIGVDL